MNKIKKRSINKRLLVLMVTALSIILISCGNKKEKGAIEFLKSNLKSPSSFKLISCETTSSETTFIYDTVYHITNIEAEGYDSTFEYYENVTSITYNAMRIYKREIFANTKYRITYEAENSFGASLKDVTDVYLLNDKYTMDILELCADHVELENEITIEGTFPYRATMESIKLDSWYEISVFGEDDWMLKPEKDINK